MDQALHLRGSRDFGSREEYPVERTLLVTGALDAAMDSRLAGGTPVDTPQLQFSYRPRDYRAMREMGQSW